MTPKKIIALNFAILTLGIGVWLLSKTGSMDVMEKFATFLLVTVGIAIFAAVFVLPLVGEWIGNLFYSSGEEVEPDEYSLAASKVAQGDYDGAIKAYQSIAKDEPDTRFPIVEIAKIQQEHLNDSSAAITTIQSALDSKQWPENDASFFMFRLADLYQSEFNDVESAKNYLNRVLDTFPETRHAANARHKLNQIEQADQRA